MMHLIIRFHKNPRRTENIPFVAYLVDNKLARDKDIARVAARSFNLPLFDIDALDVDTTVVRPQSVELTALLLKFSISMPNK